MRKGSFIRNGKKKQSLKFQSLRLLVVDPRCSSLQNSLKVGWWSVTTDDPLEFLSKLPQVIKVCKVFVHSNIDLQSGLAVVWRATIKKVFSIMFFLVKN